LRFEREGINGPKKARDKFELNEGVLVVVIEENGRLYIGKGAEP
jgi:hypothetical protein